MRLTVGSSGLLDAAAVFWSNSLRGSQKSCAIAKNYTVKIMLSLLVMFFFGLALVNASQNQVLYATPRKIVTVDDNGGHVFQENAVWNYTTMLLREDLGLLILGAREAIFALDLNKISHKRAMVKWQVTAEKQSTCSNKGKNSKIECQNYIRVLHKMSNGSMYVCGTNAFMPTCDSLLYVDGKLILENKPTDGKGKCPFDPFQRHASVLVDGDLFSATSLNFLGSEPVVMRSSSEQLRTEFKTSWLNEPNFIGMEHIAKGEQNTDGDDDEVYLFFSETAVEYDFYNKLEVARVARVCKGDLGGQRTLQKKWTSFLKARLDCPVPDPSLPFLVQDVFRFCPGSWSTCVFYAVFTPQLDTSQLSAVCAYSVTDFRMVFSKGKFKTPVTVETSSVKWVMYSGEVPDPRPGACINNEARKKGFTQSLDLPDKTLQFIKDRPLMDEAVQPISKVPLLVKKGAAFTRIAVASVAALDGSSHQVMFIGTERGSVLKAVSYDEEVVIIEEVQLFQLSEPVKILRLSSTTGYLYAGSEAAAVQMPLSSCGRYSSCLDCVLARDPYCGWDLSTSLCITINNNHLNTYSDVIQSLQHGNATHCPAVEGVKAINITLPPGNSIKLLCQPSSNHAKVQWDVDKRQIITSDTQQVTQDSLLILNASADNSGRYTCTSVESSHGQEYITQKAVYNVRVESVVPVLLPQVQKQNHTLVLLQVMVVLLALLLVGLVFWNFYKGHFVLPGHKISGHRPEAGQDSAMTHLQDEDRNVLA